MADLEPDLRHAVALDAPALGEPVHQLQAQAAGLVQGAFARGGFESGAVVDDVDVDETVVGDRGKVLKRGRITAKEKSGLSLGLNTSLVCRVR